MHMISQAQYKLQLEYLKSFMKSYQGKRKFGFTFLSDLCHRSANLLRAADNGFVALFESLKNASLLNETMFITMSDHGPRYKEMRHSPQGNLEHRLPFLSSVVQTQLSGTFRSLGGKFTDNIVTFLSLCDDETFVNVPG